MAAYFKVIAHRMSYQAENCMHFWRIYDYIYTLHNNFN